MAAKVRFALQPYPLQQDIIDHLDGLKLNPEERPYRFFVVAIGRQSGKSWLAKYTLLDRAINRQQQCVWVAPSIPTARSHWDDLVRLVQNSGLPVKKISQAAKQIIFKDGGQISVRSAVEPDNMRGLTVDYVVMDEAAFFRNGEYVWYSIVLPMVTASRGVVLFTSTPNGRNWFYRLFNQGNDPKDMLYKSWHAPSTISPYQDAELLAALEQSMPTYQWREEFLAEFLADSTGVFSGAEKAAIVELLGVPEQGHEYVAGIDFGFNTDATCITILDKYTRQQVFGLRFFNYGTIGSIRTLVRLLRVWQPSATNLEKNGIGETLFQLLKAALSGREDLPDVLQAIQDVSEDYLDVDEGVRSSDRPELAEDYDSTYSADWGGKVRAIHMNNAIKRSLVERLAAAIEYSRLELLQPEQNSYGEVQLNEMSTYQRQRTQSGLDVTYNATEGNHDDTVSALYLAYNGMPNYRPLLTEGDKPAPKNPFRRPIKMSSGSPLGTRPQRRNKRHAKRR